MCAIGRLRFLSQNHSTAHIEPTGLKYSLRGFDRQVDLIKVAYTRLNFAEGRFIPAGEKFFLQPTADVRTRLRHAMTAGPAPPALQPVRAGQRTEGDKPLVATAETACEASMERSREVVHADELH